jgi:hypothetical protein
MIIYLGRLSPTGSCSLPGTLRRRAVSRPAESETSSLLGLAPDGGCLAAALLRTPVVSYTTISPLPRLARRYVSVARSGRLPHPGCYPASCSMECGLSSASQMRNRDHPTSLRNSHHTCIDPFRQFTLAGFSAPSVSTSFRVNIHTARIIPSKLIPAPIITSKGR